MATSFTFKSHLKAQGPQTLLQSTGNSRLGRIQVRGAHGVPRNKRVLTWQHGLTKSRGIDYSGSEEGKCPHLPGQRLMEKSPQMIFLFQMVGLRYQSQCEGLRGQGETPWPVLCCVHGWMPRLRSELNHTSLELKCGP